jgi:hypothetical protein
MRIQRHNAIADFPASGSRKPTRNHWPLFDEQLPFVAEHSKLSALGAPDCTPQRAFLLSRMWKCIPRID